jgi:hypothetical protein
VYSGVIFEKYGREADLSTFSFYVSIQMRTSNCFSDIPFVMRSIPQKVDKIISPCFVLPYFLFHPKNPDT